MLKWSSSSEITLRRFRLDNFKHAFTLLEDPFCRPVHFKSPFCRLRSLSIRDFCINFVGLESDLQFLNIAAELLLKFDIDFSNVTHINIDLKLWRLSEKLPPSLKFLATKRSISLGDLCQFTSLEYLWFMCPVSPDDKEEIDQLKIQKVIVQYEDLPPEEPNLIFDMLNEWCLLEIADYLDISDWMRFGQLHEKVERALVSYKYPRAELSEGIIEESGINPYSEHFEFIAQFVTKCRTSETNNLLAMCPTLKSWTTDLCSDSPIFEELSEDQKQHFFQRVNSTLTVLKLEWLPGDGLFELHNLQEIELECEILNDQVMLLLMQNQNLRRFHIKYLGSMTIKEEIFQQIWTMKDLRDLAVNIQCDADITDLDRAIMADLLKKVGPQLTKLSLCLDLLGPEMISIAKGGFLRDIQEFHLSEWIEEGHIKSKLCFFCAMPNLKKLRFDLNGYKEMYDDDGNLLSDVEYFNILEDSDLLMLVKSLPSLVELKLPCTQYTLRFEMELRNYLKEKNRRLRINKSEFLMYIF